MKVDFVTSLVFLRLFMLYLLWHSIKRFVIFPAMSSSEEDSDSSSLEEEEDPTEAIFDALAAAAEARMAMASDTTTETSDEAELPEDFIIRRYEGAVRDSIVSCNSCPANKRTRL